MQEVPDDAVIRFPEGLPGFQSKAYVLLHREESPMIEWLQSADDPGIALMTVDPADLLLDYQPKIKAGELQAIRPEGSELDAQKLMCRVIIRRGDVENTLFVNLFAPLFFNVEHRLAIQVPLVGSGYSVREVWPPPAAPADAEGTDAKSA